MHTQTDIIDFFKIRGQSSTMRYYTTIYRVETSLLFTHSYATDLNNPTYTHNMYFGTRVRAVMETEVLNLRIIIPALR